MATFDLQCCEPKGIATSVFCKVHTDLQLYTSYFTGSASGGGLSSPPIAPPQGTTEGTILCPSVPGML